MPSCLEFRGNLLLREVNRDVPELSSERLQPFDLFSLEGLAGRVVNFEDSALSKLCEPIRAGVKTGAHENQLETRRHLAQAAVNLDGSRSHQLFHEDGDETEACLS